MKRLCYLFTLTTMLCTICACNGNTDNADATNESGNFSSEMIIENSGNFSTEMVIEPSTDVTIVQMP